VSRGIFVSAFTKESYGEFRGTCTFMCLSNFGVPAHLCARLISADYKSSWCKPNNKHGALIQYTEVTSLNRESFWNLKKATTVLLAPFCCDAQCTQPPAVAQTICCALVQNVLPVTNSLTEEMYRAFNTISRMVMVAGTLQQFVI
jgi:hypothetical protein